MNLSFYKKMITVKERAKRIQDILTLCLAEAYSTALNNQIGERWFSDFKKLEIEESHPIIGDLQKTIYDCDFQALLKILYYRSSYCDKILWYYEASHLVNSGNKKTPFQRAIARLLNDYRNELDAHLSAGKIYELSKHRSDSFFFGYEDAIRDMVGLAGVFTSVTDENGKTYYSKILKLAKIKKPSHYDMVYRHNSDSSAVYPSDSNQYSLRQSYCGKLIYSFTNQEYPLIGDRFVIGKDYDNTDFFICSEFVSRKHAIISNINNAVYLCDCGSTNGTFINGRRLDPGQNVLLTDGTRIIFADMEYIYSR